MAGQAHSLAMTRSASIPKTVSVLLFDGVNALDVCGPVEALATVRLEDGSPGYAIITYSLGALQIRTESGLGLMADAVAPDGGLGGDLLLLPGGRGARDTDVLKPVAAWIQRNQAGFRNLASICTGAYFLAEAGMVDGGIVTTHWAHSADLARRYPGVAVNADALFLRDGRIFSSGGVAAGIDLTLDLIEADYGAAAAMAVARELVVFLRRTGSQTQFSEPLRLQARGAGSLGEVCAWAAHNLGADLSVEAMAARARLSPRQFSRRFRSAFGEPPARYIHRLRLDQARAALSEPRAGVEEIAHATGFTSVDGFRRAFERRYGVAPAEFRRRFAQEGVAP